MEDPDDLESALAGMLNGAMIGLLGAAFPALLLWQAAAHWQELVSGRHKMDATGVMQGLVLTLGSAQALVFGGRMIARHLAWLRQDRAK